MPATTGADTIRVLVATDNHVGAWERDPTRGDDSWKTFHEIMCLAKERDVDMVLLGGDLFHENKPSRKAMYNVMRSLRMNCYGEKPCELEMLSDGSELFDVTFGHPNYEDPDINVAIPVFSIHGNHDDPSGEGHLAALNILEMAGLMNYFGKTPESDNIKVRPVILQKGRTKLALYGLSNVRDERLYRTFRDQKVKFFEPGTHRGEFFNILTVHQNHHAYTETSHLPENFLPNFMDLVIWGHEHECDIEPHLNPEMNFRVMQPGSSVATSLIPGEAVPKQVSILTISGKEFKSEAVRLKTVRPFVYKDLVLAEDKDATRIGRKDNHRPELTRYLVEIVEGLIEQAQQEWQEAQDEPEEDADEPAQCPLPLIRLRVEISRPDGAGKFDIENPQRFSQRFVNRVANTTDVVQWHVKKRSTTSRSGKVEDVDKEIMSRFQGPTETIRIDKLVHEFLAAQSLTILPQNHFGDAVNQYIDKDDRHAMEQFVDVYLKKQIENLENMQIGDQAEIEEDDLMTQIVDFRQGMEATFAKSGKKGLKALGGRGRYKPRPKDWDSDEEGAWEDDPAALIRSEDENDREEEDEGDDTPRPRATTTRGRGRGRGRGAVAASTRGKTTAAAAAKKPAATGRGRKKVVDDDEDSDEDADVHMIDDDDDEPEEEEEDSQAMFFRDNKKGKEATQRPPSTARGKGRGAAAAAASTRGRKAAAAPPMQKPPARTAAARAKQSTLSFTNSQASILGNGSGSGRKTRSRSASVDDDDDDDDAFEPVSTSRSRR